MTYRILVTGSRDFVDYRTVERELGSACARGMMAGHYDIVVVHGGAKGADAQASRYVADNRIRAMEAAGVDLTEEIHPADWSKGKGAGIVRNHRMVSLGADECLAFALRCAGGKAKCRAGPHPTHGTAHCAFEAESAGIPVTKVGPGW